MDISSGSAKATAAWECDIRLRACPAGVGKMLVRSQVWSTGTLLREGKVLSFIEAPFFNVFENSKEPWIGLKCNTIQGCFQCPVAILLRRNTIRGSLNDSGRIS